MFASTAISSALHSSSEIPFWATRISPKGLDLSKSHSVNARITLSLESMPNCKPNPAKSKFRSA